MPEASRGPGVPESRGRLNWRAEIRARLLNLRLPPEREAEIVEEVAQHLDDRFRELRSLGRGDDEAASDAWQELEAADVLGREVARVERPRPLDLPPPGDSVGRWRLSTLGSDLRYSIRALVKQPSFSLPVLLALALSIGPTTAIVSIANWLIWRPVAGVSRPGELGIAWFGTWREGGMSPASVSYQNIADIAGAARSITGLAGAQEQSVNLVVGDRAPERVPGAYVTHNLFRVLGMRLGAGRDFSEDDDRLPHGALVGIISDGLARSAFGSPAGALGQRVEVNRATVEVIGVAAPGFGGITTLGRVQVWVPGAAFPVINSVTSTDRYVNRSGGIFSMFVVRIADGFTWLAVEEELKILTRALSEAHPDDNKKFATATPRVFEGLGERPLTRERTRGIVRLLLAVAGVLVLLGCANAANLLVFRAGRRQREVAVRKALGASAGRLIQLQLAESWLLAVCGAGLGLVIALVLTPLLQDLIFPAMAGVIPSVPLDRRVLALTFGVATATGVFAGLAPAWMAARARLSTALAHGGGRSVARAPRLRSALAAVQLALSLTLLIGALLLVTTVRNLRSVDMGFDAEDVTTVDVELASHLHTQESAVVFWRDLHGALDAAGSFDRIAVASTAPFGGGFGIDVLRPDRDPTERINVSSNGVSHTYFDTLDTPLVRGRAFTATEALAQSHGDFTPIIVNETFALQWFGTVDALGRTVRFARTLSNPQRDLPIVGVARDVHWDSLTGSPEPFIYMPFSQFVFRATSGLLLVKSSQPGDRVTAVVRSTAAQIDRRVPIPAGLPLTARIDRSIHQERLFAWTLSILGGLGFVLAALGVYGLVAQTAAERSREFGIRIALGAGRAHIAGLVGRFATTIVGLGTAAGLALAYLGSEAVASLLFGVTALDPLVYGVAVLTLALVVALACVVPTVRAMRVQPVDVLRAD